MGKVKNYYWDKLMKELDKESNPDYNSDIINKPSGKNKE